MGNITFKDIPPTSVLPEMDSVIKRLQNLVKRNRFLHSLGTAHTMVMLSNRYGGDIKRGIYVGLIHDSARGLSLPEIRKQMEECGRPICGADVDYPKIWHARLGSLMLEETFGIRDQEMAEAIRIHPTGARGMSHLARLLFLADYIEPTRKFAGVREFRELAYSDLEKAFEAVLLSKVENVRSKGRPVHPDSLGALDEIKAGKD